MMITKMALPRRTFLRGVGATLALPLLDAMVPALTVYAKPAARPVSRLGFIYVPNGAVMEKWTPAASGRGFEFSPTLSPLEPFRDQTLVVSGLAQLQADSLRRRRRRSLARHSGVAERHPRQAHRGRRRPARRHGRSDRRARVREAHAAGLAGAGARDD